MNILHSIHTGPVVILAAIAACLGVGSISTHLDIQILDSLWLGLATVAITTILIAFGWTMLENMQKASKRTRRYWKAAISLACIVSYVLLMDLNQGYLAGAALSSMFIAAVD